MSLVFRLTTPLLLLFLTMNLTAQDGFRLKRTKKESTPFNAQVLVGYNALSTPADNIQDMFENSNLTSLGGVGVALQGMVELDTIVTRVWLGAEVSYYRMAKRWLADDPLVRYTDEDTTTVDAVETVWGLGGNLLMAIGPFARLTLIFGPGVQYQIARVDKDLPIEGNLYENRVIPTALASVNLQLLNYDHGSIDANFRGLWGFGEWGSFQYQSFLGFTFSF